MARPSPEPRRVGREQQAAGAPRLIQTSLEERRRPVASIFSDASQKVGHGTLQHRRARPDDGVSDRHAPAPTRQRSSRRLPTTHDPRPMPLATSAMKTTRLPPSLISRTPSFRTASGAWISAAGGHSAAILTLVSGHQAGIAACCRRIERNRLLGCKANKQAKSLDDVS
jgi:hypothetical protein